MKPLRGSLLLRLTCSYGLSMLCMAVVFSGTAALLSSWLGEAVNARMQATTERIPAVLAQVRQPGASLISVAPQIIARLKSPGIAVDIIDVRKGKALVRGALVTLDPTHMMTRRFERPMSPVRFMDNDHRQNRLFLSVVLGLHPIEHLIPDGEIVLIPQITELGAPYIFYILELIVLAIVASATAGAIGFTMTLGAVTPLRQVTEALRYLANGDFRAHEVQFSTRSEIGELADAYNKAASRVTQAISERERAEMQMRQFIADASHELRTPLTVLLCYVDVLRTSYIEDKDLRERILQTMTIEGERMRSLISNLILLMRMEHETGRPIISIDLTHLVEKVVASMRALDPHGRIQVDYNAEARIGGDADELYEATMNILDNALKYAPEGTITITVDHNADTSWLNIADNGPGIPAEELPFIFERFYRGTERVEIEGSGLGLSIAQRAVQRAGGNITVTSSPQSGTCFRLTFPLLHDQAEEAPAEVEPEEGGVA
jgi:signal transduction histidine kinase